MEIVLTLITLITKFRSPICGFIIGIALTNAETVITFFF